MGYFVTTEEVQAILQDAVNHQLVSITVENFQSLKERTTMYFDERGILNPVGYNNSGKTAFLTSQPVLQLDAHANKQVRMIHWKQPYFLIENAYTDGVIIRRKKFRTGESQWEMFKDDQLIYANRASVEESSRMIATHGVPEPLRLYFNLAFDESTGEVVNFRKNRDKLFLVHTSAGDNGKIINSLLQLENVTLGLGKLNKRKNSLTSDLTMFTSQYKTIYTEASAIDVMAEEEEEMLRQITEIYQNLITQGLQVEAVQELVQNMKKNVQYDELAMIDTTQYRMFKDIETYLQTLRKDVQPEVPTVSTEQYNLIAYIKEKREGVKALPADEVSLVDTSQLKEYATIKKLRENINVTVPEQVEVLPTEQFNEWQRIKNLRDAINVDTYEEVQSTAQVAERYRDFQAITQTLTTWHADYAEQQRLDAEAEELNALLSHLSTTYNYKICNACGTLVV